MKQKFLRLKHFAFCDCSVRPLKLSSSEILFPSISDKLNSRENLFFSLATEINLEKSFCSVSEYNEIVKQKKRCIFNKLYLVYILVDNHSCIILLHVFLPCLLSSVRNKSFFLPSYLVPRNLMLKKKLL